MKRLSIICVICAMALTHYAMADSVAAPPAPAPMQPAKPAANWVAFRDPGRAFTANMPAAITTSSLSDPAADGGAPIHRMQYMSSADGGQSAAFIYVSDVSRFASTAPSQMMQGAVDAMKKYLRQTDSDTAINQDGRQGQEIRGTAPNGWHIVDRIFLINLKMYQFVSSLPAAPSPGQNEMEARFLSGIHFLQQAGLQTVSVVCKAPDLSDAASFSYRLDYVHNTVTEPAGAVRPVQMTDQEITWDDASPDGQVKNTLQRYSGQLTQVKANQSFSFSCKPG